jgi:probable phosphoglycerate mutase
VHLNETGQKQAQAVAQRLAQAPITAIYSSPLERAQETAAPLAQLKGLSVTIHDGIGETRYGDWTGQSLKRLARTKLWRVAQQQPSAMRFPNGETMRGSQLRMVEALESIALQHPKPKQVIAVFTHADPIRLAVAWFLGVPLDLFQRITVNTGSITTVRVGQGQPVLVKLNDTSAFDSQ